MESGSGRVSPLIVVVFRSVLCILCFSTTPSRNRQGFYIVRFRTRQFCVGEESLKSVDVVEDGPHHVARKWDHVVDPLFHLLALDIDFFFLGSLFP
jgi:hypothetical protein